MTVAARGYESLRRNPAQSIGWAVGVVLIAIVAFRGESTRDIVTQSPCLINAESAKCQTVKKESDEARSVSSTCVLFYKVDKEGRLLRNTVCPVRPGGAETDGASTPNAPSVPDQSSTPHKGSSTPGPSGGQQPTSPHKGGGKSEQQQGGGDSEGEGAPPPEEHPGSEASPSASHPVVEAVEGAVESVTGLVPEAVCGLPVATCP